MRLGKNCFGLTGWPGDRAQVVPAIRQPSTRTAIFSGMVIFHEMNGDREGRSIISMGPQARERGQSLPPAGQVLAASGMICSSFRRACILQGGMPPWMGMRPAQKYCPSGPECYQVQCLLAINPDNARMRPPACTGGHLNDWRRETRTDSCCSAETRAGRRAGSVRRWWRWRNNGGRSGW